MKEEENNIKKQIKTVYLTSTAIERIDKFRSNTRRKFFNDAVADLLDFALELYDISQHIDDPEVKMLTQNLYNPDLVNMIQNLPPDRVEVLARIFRAQAMMNKGQNALLMDLR